MELHGKVPEELVHLAFSDDRKVDGNYLFARPEKIGISGQVAAEYTEVCNLAISSLLADMEFSMSPGNSLSSSL